MKKSSPKPKLFYVNLLANFLSKLSNSSQCENIKIMDYLFKANLSNLYELQINSVQQSSELEYADINSVRFLDSQILRFSDSPIYYDTDSIFMSEKEIRLMDEYFNTFSDSSELERKE